MESNTTAGPLTFWCRHDITLEFVWLKKKGHFSFLSWHNWLKLNLRAVLCKVAQLRCHTSLKLRKHIFRDRVYETRGHVTKCTEFKIRVVESYSMMYFMDAQGIQYVTNQWVDYCNNSSCHSMFGFLCHLRSSFIIVMCTFNQRGLLTQY